MKKFVLEYYVSSEPKGADLKTPKNRTYVYRVLTSEDEAIRWRARLNHPFSKAPYRRAQEIILREIV